MDGRAGDAIAIEVRLLGPFRVVVAGRDVPASAWGRRKARALVKLLALAPDRALHREQLLDQLWPELAPLAAANNFYQALHLARNAFAAAGVPLEQALPYGEERLRLAPNLPIAIDCEQFAAAAAHARAKRELAAYRTALGWYRGDLLPEDPYEPWAEEPRTHFRALHIALLLECAAIAERAGQTADAIDALQTAIAADPCHEPAHRALMALLARAGRRGDALRLFDQLAAALARDLAVEPEAATRRLAAAIRSAANLPAAPQLAADLRSVPRHNLPAATTSFIGREHETADVARLLATARLVTLTGPGGCGKTRLALAVADRQLASFVDGVWFVDLAPVTDPDGVAPALAAVLGLRETPGQPLRQMLFEAIGRRRLLVVLDNCEQVVAACAEFAAALIQRCPGLALLATSREPLRIAGEFVRPVPSLPLPDPHRPQSLADVLAFDSVRLFVERAQAGDPAYQPSEEEAGALAQLCFRLDGMPLAIELAAARHHVLSVAEIATRLDDRFRLLAALDRHAIDRQRTLQATLDWSHDLLTDEERRVFRRLAVFPASFDLEAAERVIGHGGWGMGDGEYEPARHSPSLITHDPPPMTLVASLVEKSLLLRERFSAGTRFRMLETIRQYGGAWLAASGEEPDARRLHATHYLSLAEAVAHDCYGPAQDASLDRLDPEHDNLRAAISWSLGPAGDPEIALRLVTSLVWYWQVRGPLAEGREALTRAAAIAGADPRLSARAVAGLGAVTFFQDDFALARDVLGTGLERLKRVGDHRWRARTLGWYALLHVFQNDLERGRALALQADALHAEIGDHWGRATAHMALTFADVEADRIEQAIGSCRQALVWYRQLGEHWGSALAARTLGSISYRQGDYVAAREHASAALAIERAQRDPWLIVQSLSLMGEIARAQGDWDEAIARCTESLARSRECGHRANVAWSLRSLGFVAAEQGRLGEAAELLAEALTIFRGSPYPLGMLCSLAGLTVAAVSARAWDDAARWAGAVTALLAPNGGRFAPADQQAFERALETLRQALPPDRMQLVWSAGAAMSLDDAANHALAAAAAMAARGR